MRKLFQVAALATLAGILYSAPVFAGGITGGVRNQFGSDYNRTVRNLHVTGSSSLDLVKTSNIEFCGKEFSAKAFKDFTANDFRVNGDAGNLFIDGSLTFSTGYTESATAVHGREQTKLVQKQNERFRGTERTEEGSSATYHEASSFGKSVF